VCLVGFPERFLCSKRICERSIVTSIGYFTGNGPIELVLCMRYQWCSGNVGDRWCSGCVISVAYRECVSFWLTKVWDGILPVRQLKEYSAVFQS